MRRTIFLLGLSFAFIGSTFAQDQAALAPPKVLLIVRENLKPGKAGTTHEKSESAFVNAFKVALSPHGMTLSADAKLSCSLPLCSLAWTSPWARRIPSAVASTHASLATPASRSRRQVTNSAGTSSSWSATNE